MGRETNHVEPPLIVAIDGPAGGGKSTAARRLAGRLGVPYLDTGAMYRAIALAVLDSGRDPDDAEAVLDVAARAELSLVGQEDGTFSVHLDGRPVESRIRAPRVGEAASKVSTYPAVRERMVSLQRASAQRFGGVLEGRDIGTQVFPDTPHKFFVFARPEIRAERRYLQHLEQGKEVTREGVLHDLTERDRRDESREASPLTVDDSYLQVDTSELTADEVVDRLERAVRERR
jgi:CMP/dCMP kinase